MRRSSMSRWKPITNARWRSGRLRGGGVRRKLSTNALLATFALAFPLDLYVARRHPPLRLNNISTLCLHSNHKNSDRGDPPPGPETQIHRSMNRTQRKREQVVWLCVFARAEHRSTTFGPPLTQRRRGSVFRHQKTQIHSNGMMDLRVVSVANAPPLKNSMGRYTFTSLGS